VHVLAKLLSDLRRIVRGDSWWGQPLGSSQLWGKHVQTIDRIGAIASSIRSAEVLQKKQYNTINAQDTSCVFLLSAINQLICVPFCLLLTFDR
jgi:hypothetical protein